MGAAMTGLRPIAEIMFSDFFAVCWDIVVNEIAKTRYMTDGQVTLPAGDQDRQRRRPALRRPALAVHRELGDGGARPQGRRRRRLPSDVVGLMAAAIRDDDPVLFFEHKGLYATKGEVPDGDIVDSLGTAKVRRPGTDCHDRRARADGAARARGRRQLAARASRPTVIDLRVLVPLDTTTILAIGREDRPAVHRRGEPAAARVGRRDRVDRRGGVLLGPRRPDPAASRPRTSRCRRPTPSRTS